MAHTETALRDAVTLAAWAVGIVGLVLQVLACTAELLRRHRPAARLVELADRLAPAVSRRWAVAMFTAVATLVAVAAPRASAPSATVLGVAGPDVGDPSTLRGWLTQAQPSTPSATSPATPHSSAPTIPREVPTPSTTTLPPTAADASEPVPPLRPSITAVPAAPTASTPAPATASSAPPRAPDTYTVAAGDCLWSIARHQLGPRVSERAVDRGWRAIYAANAARIGTDPNLIHPGLVLVLPPLDPTP